MSDSASPKSNLELEVPIELQPDEDVSGLVREDLEDRYLDLKDEAWRLRRQLSLDPVTGRVPSNGG